MLTLKLTTIGKSAGLIFPKEALSRLEFRGAILFFLTEAKKGYLLTPYDPEFAAPDATGRGCDFALPQHA